jgi:DNA-binding beta-propeller fold protein YncE
VPLSQVPSAIVVDTRTARAFITMVGGSAGAGQVQVFDTGTWRLLRTVVVGTGALISAVDERTGRVFVAYENVRVRVLDARSGDLLRTVSIGRWPAIPYLPFAMGLTVDEPAGPMSPATPIPAM